MSYQLNPLSTALGAEIIGLDLRSDLNPALVEMIQEALHEHLVLVFRDQSFTLEEQIQACGQFGEIELHPALEVPWKYREVTYVANTDPTYTQIFEHCGPPFELWHSDTCYLPEPARMSFLYAERVPNEGGETLFINTVKAYDDLPDDLKMYLADKKAVFSSGKGLMERCQARGYDLNIPLEETHPDVIHPVIRTHPYSGNKSIFVNWAHTDRILDISEEESNALLRNLHVHCLSASYRYVHYPRQGDLIVWDNAGTLHANSAKKLTEIRVMRRVMIKGTTPY